ncbi:MAG: hypothetical protein EPO27_11260 [Betaproteobacteria bacterium]|nr:MAG: hypothetical protein EPO27_11260 [Betaproteobacteria bacterium]
MGKFRPLLPFPVAFIISGVGVDIVRLKTKAFEKSIDVLPSISERPWTFDADSTHDLPGVYATFTTPMNCVQETAHHRDVGLSGFRTDSATDPNGLCLRYDEDLIEQERFRVRLGRELNQSTVNLQGISHDSRISEKFRFVYRSVFVRIKDAVKYTHGRVRAGERVNVDVRHVRLA